MIRLSLLVSLGLIGFTLACPAEPCDAITIFADGKQPIRELFVSPDGNNSSGDGSRDNPWQTISRAADDSRPGDAIRLLPGNHSPGAFIQSLHGSAEQPIWLGGVPGEDRPVISGGNQAIHFVRARYLVVENIEVTGSIQNGINCDDGGDTADPDAARHILFRNIIFSDIGTGGNQDALKLSGVDDYAVLDCEFARSSAGGSGIDHVGCHAGLIAGCTFVDMGSNAIQCKGGSSDIEIRRNRFYNAGLRAINIGGSTGFQFFRPPLSRDNPNVEARNIRVIANLFEGSDTPVAFVGTVDSVVANNTMVNPTIWLMRILQETTSTADFEFLPCSNNAFINNLVTFSRGVIRTFVNIGPNTDAASFEFAHNLWYAHDDPGQSLPTLPAVETNGIAGSDPLLRNVLEQDFSITSDSPAVGKGQRTELVKADFLDTCFADLPSIGAYELQPVGPGPDRDDDGMPDAWEALHQFDADDPDDAQLDFDGDLLSNVGEFIAGTDPTQAGSVFSIIFPRLEAGEMVFSYGTQAGRLYRVEGLSVTENNWTEVESRSGDGRAVEVRRRVDSMNGQLFRVAVEMQP